jgi:predicted RNase H-like HicB family nuclease
MRVNSYAMMLWWSAEDHAYVVEVPELHGRMAHGATRQAAVKNAEKALALWVESARDDGLEIPRPRGRLMLARSFDA